MLTDDAMRGCCIVHEVREQMKQVFAIVLLGVRSASLAGGGVEGSRRGSGSTDVQQLPRGLQVPREGRRPQLGAGCGTEGLAIAAAPRSASG
jgi:hypothetical protein